MTTTSSSYSREAGFKFMNSLTANSAIGLSRQDDESKAVSTNNQSTVL